MATTNSAPTAIIGKRTRPLTPRRSSTSTSDSISSTSPSSSSSVSSPENKIARSSTSPDKLGSADTEGGIEQRAILCTLPPTCNRHPITLANSGELERHYAMYHAHVCEFSGCGCVFPEARLLELHQTECHDPLAAVRKERGEKIFECMVATCTRFFQTPKARRLHMIEVHKYPKEFFFAVTNKGIGGLLKKWGEGASMIRGEWKPRDNAERNKDQGKTEGEDRMMIGVDNDEDEVESLSSEDVEEVDMEELERTPRPGVRTLHPTSPPRGGNAKINASVDVEALAEGMSSLTLVPNSIRFGRGVRGGGLGARGRGRGGRGGILPPQSKPSVTGHQRRASTSSVSDQRQLGVEEPGSTGKGQAGRKGRGHRASVSIGAGIEMNISGGEVVLLPPSGGRGLRGHGGKAGRGGSR